MGVVYRARHATLGREVALKVIVAGRDADAELVTRFIREAKAAAQLAGHPGIVGVHDIGEAEGRVYFAMDLVEGASLEALIDRAEVTPQRAAEVLEGAARAVHHAHGQGILHRDLKPANILVTTDGRARVADFGLAQVRDAGGAASRLTRSGEVLGTPAYMSPEQAQGMPLDPQADVWSLGATLYEALTGAPPFDGSTVYDVLLKVLRAEPLHPRRRDPRVSLDLSTIALKCLEKTPVRRYPTAEALAEDLARWRRGDPILARPPSLTRRVARLVRRRRGLASAVAGVSVALVASGAVVLPRWQAASDLAAAAEQRERQRMEAAPHVAVAETAVVSLDRLKTRRDPDRAVQERIAAEGRAATDRALAACREHATALLARGRIEALSGHAVEARRWLDLAVAADPGYAPARLERALLLFDLQDRIGERASMSATTSDADQAEIDALVAASRADLVTALPALLATSDRELAAGLLAWTEGRQGAAADRLLTAAEGAATDWRLWYWAARAVFARDQRLRFEVTERAFTEAISYRPGDARLYFGRGMARMMNGKTAESIEDFDVVASLEPAHPEVYYHRAYARGEGDPRGSLADWDRVVQAAPESLDARMQRAHVRRKSGDLGGALDDYGWVIAQRGYFLPQAYRARALARKAMGDLPGALADLDALLASAPDCDWDMPFVDRAGVREAVGDLVGARADLDAAIRVCSEDAWVFYRKRGHVHRKLGDAGKAAADLEVAFALAAADATPPPELASELAEARVAAGIPRESAEASISARWPRVLKRARLRAMFDDLPGALKDFEQVLVLTGQGHAIRATVEYHRDRVRGHLARASKSGTSPPSPEWIDHYLDGLDAFRDGPASAALAAWERALATMDPEHNFREQIRTNVAQLRLSAGK